MAEITAKLVKELREKSGAGVMDAKKALVEVEGDIEKAIELLREKGMAKAAKKADRVAAEGLTGVYVNGNVAAVVEVNAETDFVAKNAQFVELVNATAKVIAEGKPANNEEALALTMPSGETLEAAYVSATATIGEKISFRRFALLEKTDAQHFGAYQHNGGRIGVISVIEGGDEALAKQISMHIAAMKPTVLSYTELDEQFVKDELAQLNHAIDQDNESRAMVGKPALPHLKFGSKAQLTDEVVAQAEEDIKAELAAEGKRWYDMIRYAKSKNYAHKSAFITLVQQYNMTANASWIRSVLQNEYAWYLPIHAEEIENNILLVQNPYYGITGNNL